MDSTLNFHFFSDKMNPSHKPIFRQASQFFVLLFLLGLYSCTKDTICLTPKVVGLRGGFYYEDSIGVYKDTLLINSNLYFGSALNYFQNLKQSAKFNLSLAQNTDAVTFYFQSDSTSTDPETIDSLLVTYIRDPHFISSACGYETFFYIQNINYSTNIIDTVIVTNADVNNDVNKEHIKIVIRK